VAGEARPVRLRAGGLVAPAGGRIRVMDSKDVNKEIRRTIRPLLREAGFTHFTARTAWRHVGSRVEVLNFQSFNSYTADVLGCTTYSFCINLGTYLQEVPSDHVATRIKEVDGKLLPQEYHCHLRGGLRPGFEQPECARREIWYIDPAGRYLEEAVCDVRAAVLRDAFPWYESLRDPAGVLHILLEEPERMNRLWGFGRVGSPIRSYVAGYVAFALGRQELAKDQLEKALRSGCFETVAARIGRDLEACGRPTA
jgi:uncharacterized protein DUF4304